LIARPSQKHSGSLPGEHSFLRIEPDNVVLTAVKKAEDDDSLILRFYEWAGKEADVKLQLPAGAQSASETDLMERPTADLAVKSNAVTVHTKPYEIKTLKVKFAEHASVQ
jgi:alpha-mannosidase